MPSKRAGAAGSTRYNIEAVARTAELIQQFSRTAPRLSTRDLTRLTGISAGLVDRTLFTLQQHGLIRTDQSAGNVHELGLRWLQLADIRRRQVDIRLLALPVMRRIRDAVNETVILSIRAGNRRVNIDYVESTQAIRRLTQLGYEVSLHIGATGRVLLSGLAPEELREYLKSTTLAVIAGGASISEKQLRDDLEGVRQFGYAVAFREITSDTAAVSAPIRDNTDEIVAALTISCPEERFTRELKQACIKHVTAAARDLSQDLGHKAAKSPLR
jgi:IclR family KDG regulon transcriptional repressor